MPRPAHRALAVLGLLLIALTLTASPAFAEQAFSGVRAGVAPAPSHPGSERPARDRPAAAPAEPGGLGLPLVVVGTGGFTWSDVTPEATPALWKLLREGAAATLSVRSVNPNTCPVDGWLSLSAGERAAAPADGEPLRPLTVGCPGIPDVSDGHIEGWDALRDAAAGLRFGAQPGLLGLVLDDSRVSTAAYGPGAALALARMDGSIAAALPVDAAFETLGDADVSVVDAGAVRDPDDLGTGEAAPGPSAADQLAAIDATIGRVVEQAGPQATIVVAALSDAGRGSRLRPVVAVGPGIEPGELYSASTRMPGLAQSADLTVTILQAAGVAIPSGQGGKPLVARDPGEASESAAAERRTALIDLDLASNRIHGLVPPFFYGLVIAQLVIYLLVWRVWSRRYGSAATRERLVRWSGRIALVAAAVPAASFLANLLPWWRAEHPLPAIIGSVALFAALIVLPAALPPAGRHLLGPVAVVGAATMLVLAADVMTGSRLQMSSLMGLQPVVGGRFYGMGNVTFSLFATATMMLAIALAHPLVQRGRRTAAAALVTALGVLAVIIDGSPGWGADGGGPPALLPGLAYLVLAILGLRMTWRRMTIIALVTAALFLVVGYLDSLRPADKQSHLGRFFDTLGTSAAGDIVLRKAEQNLAILLSSPLSLLVPFGLLFTIYVLLRPTSWGSRALHASFERIPTLRPGLIGWLVVMTIGFFINDSGVAIPAVGATIALPLVIVVATGTLLRELTARRDPAAG